MGKLQNLFSFNKMDSKIKNNFIFQTNNTRCGEETFTGTKYMLGDFE
jgi:hypothetical protein